MESPTSRSLAYLRKQGYIAQVVEKWNPYARIRQDLFGFIDIVAISPELGIVGVQATSRSNMSARLLKIITSYEAQQWLESGGKIFIYGWSKNKKKHWEIKTIEVTKESFVFTVSAKGIS